MIVRRMRRFGDESGTLVPASDSPASDTIDVHVKPSTVTSGIALWVTAGVLTHLAIRFIDGWLDHRKKRD